MAAVSSSSVPALRELSGVRAAQLDPLMEEAIAEWRESLDWDFRPSAELVQRFVDRKALGGFALTSAAGLIGYSYYVVEERKGLIGDLYVRKRFRCREYEDRLLDAVLGALLRNPNVRRIEAQLMLLPSSLERSVPRHHYQRTYPRLFMEIRRHSAARLLPVQPALEVCIRPWLHAMQEEAAQVIAAAYAGHIDSEINDQYRSAAGARRFLLNIVQYPGCGTFFQPGSFVAARAGDGALCGVSLASLVARDVGHITQICVLPSARGAGLGYELLRHSLDGLVRHGCRKVSLTVTAANSTAVQLYERMRFATAREFAAYVWEGF